MRASESKIKREVHVSFSEAQTGRTLPLAIGPEIGSGSMSIVCSGRVAAGGDGEPVAVKILRPSLVSTPAEERFMREAELLCRLTHPNIVRGLGMGGISDESDPSRPTVPFLVLERIAGIPLDRLLAENASAGDVRAALELILGVSSALGYLHLDGRVQAHRDIKPGNIIVCSDDTPKLIDLGVAKTHLVSRRPLDTRLAGTVRYMSPEQLADSSRVDIRSDIYALGIVFLELLGCARGRMGDGREALAARFDRTPPRLSDDDARRLRLAGTHREAVDGLLASMCAYEPHDRFQTPRELTAAVQEVLDELDRPAGRPKKPGRIPRRIALLATALCAVLAVCMVMESQLALENQGHTHKAQPPPGREIIVEDGSPDNESDR